MEWTDRETVKAHAAHENCKPTATKLYNIVILDRSGTMQSIRHEAVDGFNETLATIKQAQRRNAAEQAHFVSLIAFCSCGLLSIVEDTPCMDVPHLRNSDYEPCCSTPLYDAMGTVLTHYERKINAETDAVGVVTVITDGYENASREFTCTDISTIVERLKEKGWMFSYIGADHDVMKVAVSLKIDNVMEFKKTHEGTQNMFYTENMARGRYYDQMAETHLAEPSIAGRKKKYKQNSENYFGK